VFDVKGLMDLEDFREETGIVLPEGEYDTVGGFVFHRLGRLPSVGDEVRWDRLRFRVREMDGRRIGEVRVYQETPEGPPDEKEAV
jgi:putative hemolysin